MVTYTYIKKVALGRMCRKCINQEFHGNLKSKDCYYSYYPSECSVCGEPDKNIVIGIRLKKRYKLLMMKKIR